MGDAQRHGRLTSLFDSEAPRLFGVLARLTLRHDAAADLLQDLFLRLSASPAFDAAADPTAFAWRTAINLATDWRRRQSRDRSRGSPVREQDLPPDGSPSPLERLGRDEDVARVLDGLADLSELARTCFVLRFLEDLSYEHVARRVGKTPQQVRGLCHAAVRRLRARLNEDETAITLPESHHA